MLQNEAIIERYFFMWLNKDGSMLKDIFDDNIIYSECYGPEYNGINQIVKWFNDWNEHNTVLKWDITQCIHHGNTTVAEWYFQCNCKGNVTGFNGVSIVTFGLNGKITEIKEFQSKAEHYFPYGTL